MSPSPLNLDVSNMPNHSIITNVKYVLHVLERVNGYQKKWKTQETAMLLQNSMQKYLKYYSVHPLVFRILIFLYFACWIPCYERETHVSTAADILCFPLMVLFLWASIRDQRVSKGRIQTCSVHFFSVVNLKNCRQESCLENMRIFYSTQQNEMPQLDFTTLKRIERKKITTFSETWLTRKDWKNWACIHYQTKTGDVDQHYNNPEKSKKANDFSFSPFFKSYRGKYVVSFAIHRLGIKQ